MYLFTIEGIDGSGKATQLAMLKEKLENKGYKVLPISFPNYSDRSSGPVKMYLEGELGEKPSDVSAYAASSLFAVDRFASYKKSWEKPYKEGTVIISDRYVLSNIIHQASKLDEKERPDYISWLFDFEYNKLGIPEPSLSFFLDVPPEVSVKNMAKRYSGDETRKDIHEKDVKYLENCYNTAVSVFSDGKITVVPCVENGDMLSAETISEFIFKEIKKKLGE